MFDVGSYLHVKHDSYINFEVFVHVYYITSRYIHQTIVNYHQEWGANVWEKNGISNFCSSVCKADAHF